MTQMELLMYGLGLMVGFQLGLAWSAKVKAEVANAHQQTTTKVDPDSDPG